MSQKISESQRKIGVRSPTGAQTYRLTSQLLISLEYEFVGFGHSLDKFQGRKKVSWGREWKGVQESPEETRLYVGGSRSPHTSRIVQGTTERVKVLEGQYTTWCRSPILSTSVRDNRWRTPRDGKWGLVQSTKSTGRNGNFDGNVFNITIPSRLYWLSSNEDSPIWRKRVRTRPQYYQERTWLGREQVFNFGITISDCFPVFQSEYHPWCRNDFLSVWIWYWTVTNRTKRDLTNDKVSVHWSPTF